jgi:hypothetical protein
MVMGLGYQSKFFTATQAVVMLGMTINGQLEK